MFTVFVLNLHNFAFDSLIFWPILIPFSIFGLLNDMADRKEVRGGIAKLAELQLHYFIIPLILLIVNVEYWIILVVSLAHIISYESIKHFFKKKGYH